jgi:hypothetical protein
LAILYVKPVVVVVEWLTFDIFQKSCKQKLQSLRKSSVAIELKDDIKNFSYVAMGLATFSNSASTVSSYPIQFLKYFENKLVGTRKPKSASFWIG